MGRAVWNLDGTSPTVSWTSPACCAFPISRVTV